MSTTRLANASSPSSVYWSVSRKSRLMSRRITRCTSTPTLQRPDLLTAVSTTPPDVDCAAALDLTDQDPTINQMMASLVLQVVRRMVAGTCPFMGLYLDMEQGTVTPTYATPEAVQRVVRSDALEGT